GVATFFVLVSATLQIAHVRTGAMIHNALTAMKILLVVAMIVAGFVFGDVQQLVNDSVATGVRTLWTPGFAVGLLVVSFSYTGWNAAIYLAGELDEPAKNLPKALLGGTSIVILLYMGFNLALFAAVPKSALEGVLEVGYVAAVHLSGERAGRAVAAII